METSSWSRLIEINDLIRSTGFTYLKYLLLTLVVVGIIRAIYLYAKAAKINSVYNSMWVFRFVDWIVVKNKWEDKSEFLDGETWEEDRKIIPVGINPVGLIGDILIIGIICSVILFVWPLFLISSVSILPLQMCRNYHMRKREFIATLKGEKTNA